MDTLFGAIEIGGTKLQLVLGDQRGRILERKRLAVDAAKGAAGILNQIEATLPELLRARAIKALGVGFGGPVDWRTGRIARSHQIEGWSDFDLPGWVGGLASCPVVVDNDANIAALGEAIHGVGRNFNPVFYVTLGSGVGGGLVVDGKIYHGAKPGEAEIGHLRLDRLGTTVESKCSGWAIDARVRKELGKSSPPPRPRPRNSPATTLNENTTSPVTTALEQSSPGGEAKWLAPALAQGNPVAKEILQELAEDLAFALSHVVHLFHPQIIVLGGGLAGIGGPLLEAVSAALVPLVMEVFRPGLQIAQASLGEDAISVGALECALRLHCSR